jgi:hypothetical protein
LALARTLGSFCEQQWRAARLTVVSYAISETIISIRAMAGRSTAQPFVRAAQPSTR